MFKTFTEQIKQSYACWNGINRVYSDWARKQGLSYYSLFTLYAIYYDSEGCSQKKICEEWAMPKQTVHSILQEFKQKNYVYFVTDEQDRRNKFIYLTESGRVYAKRILDKLFAVEEIVLQKMDGTLREQMIRANEVYYRLLEKEMERDEFI